LPSRLITTPDWLAALFVQVRSTDVGLAAFAVRFDGASGTTVSVAPGAAMAGGAVHRAVTPAKATSSSRLLGLVMSFFIVPPPLLG